MMTEKQSKNKVLILIIAILLISNIAILTFFLMKKDGGHMEKRPDRKAMIADFLKKEIGFSEAQLQQYDTLSDRHRENVKKMFENLRSSKDKQFKQLTAGDFSDSIINSVADQSAASQKTMELQMFNHLKSIRTLCTPEQLPKFDSLFVKILNRRGGEGRKKAGN
jgi:Spy/CpxP family protein refolding chaperone